MTTTESPRPALTLDATKPGRWNTTVTLADGSRWEVALDRFAYNDRSRTEASKIFVWGAEPALPAPPFSDRGADALLDARWDAYHRLEALSMKVTAIEVLAALGADVTRANFSRTAGCSCPCSPGLNLPGFIVTDDETLPAFRQAFITRTKS